MEERKRRIREVQGGSREKRGEEERSGREEERSGGEEKSGGLRQDTHPFKTREVECENFWCRKSFDANKDGEQYTA